MPYGMYGYPMPSYPYMVQYVQPFDPNTMQQPNQTNNAFNMLAQVANNVLRK